MSDIELEPPLRTGFAARLSPKIPFGGIGAALARLGQTLARLGVGLVLPLGLFGLWWLASSRGWLAPQILPEPVLIWDAFLELWGYGDLQSHSLISLQRVALGFGLGAVVGLPLGAAMGLSTLFRRWVDPIFIMISQIPPIGWIPVLMVFLGLGESLKLVIIAKAAMIPMAINTYAAFRNVPVQWQEVGQVFSFSKSEQLRWVVLPAALPGVFTGIRYGLTNAWLALVAVELLASSEGLGYLMVWGRQMFAMEYVILAMIFIGGIGFALDWGLARLEAHLLRWKESRS